MWYPGTHAFTLCPFVPAGRDVAPGARPQPFTRACSFPRSFASNHCCGSAARFWIV